jgi:hypothetical protein
VRSADVALAFLSEPTVYGVLDRLEETEWITGRWEEHHPQLSTPRRRFYHLTPTGAHSHRRRLSLSSGDRAPPCHAAPSMATHRSWPDLHRLAERFPCGRCSVSTDLGKVIFLAVVTAVVGLLVMESYQTTPWLADRVIKWSVRLRYADSPERAQVRGEELIALLGDLPTLFKLPTAGAFLLRALVYRLANRRSPARRKPRAVQRFLGVRFRIALARSVLVVVCVGAVFGMEAVYAVNAAYLPAG